MAMRIAFDSNRNPITPSIILTNRNGNRLGLLTNVYNIVVNGSIDTPEMSFNVLKEDNGVICNLWDSIKDFKLIWCKEWDMWFEIAVELQDNSNGTVKSVTATALCESELSQIMLYEIEINTEDDIARDDYEIPTTIYNPEHPEASLLNRITEKAPHYSIEHVDSSLMNIQKTFKFDGKSLKDALDEIAEEIECLVVYGNTTSNTKISGISVPKRTISLYDLKCVCSECGYRGDNITVCPECGSNIIIDGYGNDTNIFISKDNLTDDITFSANTDNVKNCFRLVAGDDLMTATIKNCNPNGSSYIWHISKDIKDDMSEELVDKLEEYDNLYEYYKSKYVCNLTYANLADDTGKYIITDDGYMLIADIDVSQYNALVNKYKSLNEDLQPITPPVIGYPSLMKILYETIDFRLYLNDGLLPSISIAEKTAATQAALLTPANLSPIAVSNVSTISGATADSNVLAMAKIVVGSKFRVKINDSTFSKDTLTWRGNFIVTNYSDEDDTATSSTISIQISDDYERYVKQKLDKILTDGDTDDYSVSELFKKKLTVTQGISGNVYSGEFMKNLGYYALSYLKSIHDCCQSCLDILVEQGVADGKTWGNSTPNLYKTLYLDYYNKLAAIEYEMKVRESEVQVVDIMMNTISSEQEDIQSKLNFQEFIGDELWKVFVSYRRDDEYSNTNYISDGLNNAELFDKALEFIKIAEKEIVEAATIQHTLSSTLKNLLVIKDFEKLLDSFEIGNWLRINVDGSIYKLRLLSYDIDFDNLSELNVEFSDVVYAGDVYSDTKSIAKTVSSMASSYDYVARQASKGDNANKTIRNWVSNGLDATLTKIVNNADNQDIVYDSHGLLFRSYDFTTDSYLPTQLKIVNSTLANTDDNCETTKTAVGKYIYLNPETNKMEVAFGINAEVLVGKLILGESLGIYNASGSLRFDTDGFRITNGINTVTINPNSNRLFVLSNEKQDVFWVDTNGNVCIVGDGTAIDISANDEIKGLTSQITQTSDSITSEVKRAKDAEEELSTKITQTSDSITSEVAKNQSKYDTTGYSVTLFGYTSPSSAGYKAANYSGKYYLNQSNGYLYLSNGTSWIYQKSLLLITSVLSSSIEQNATAITSKVSTSEFGTLVQQNSNSVKIAWNNISKYIQFESGELRIYDSAVTSTQKMVSKFNYNGSHFYRDNVYIGKIGTNNWSGDTSYRGLVFDLEYAAQYMCWAAEDTENAGSYTVKLIYHHSSSKEKNGLHLGCNFYVGGQLYVNDNVRTVNYADGSAGLYSTSQQVSLSGTTAKISGTGASFEASNGKFVFYNSTNLLVDCYNNLDMHNYDILNQSDARLKTNIEDTDVEALSKISGIEMKQFDWIENGEHVDIGVIAQQLQKVLPDLVYEDAETGKLSIKMLEFIPYIIKAIQELNSKVETNSSSSNYSISTFSLRNALSNDSSDDTWVDTYTMEEKTAFVEATKEPVDNQLEIVEDKPITIEKEKENIYE